MGTGVMPAVLTVSLSLSLFFPVSHSFKENHKVNLTKTVFGVQFKCQGIARIRILYH
jgi:hypothetical protein